MILTDTHTHLYAKEFDNDRDVAIQHAIALGVQRIFLPNIDSTSIAALLSVVNSFPKNCFAMMGLHPCSVNTNYIEELNIIEQYLSNNKESKIFHAVGEIGIDLYWDTSFKAQQEEALKIQISFAEKNNLPIIIHCRNSFRETIDLIKNIKSEKLTGIFHCFSGTKEDAEEVVAIGFKLGIGGVVTFKNGGIDKIIQIFILMKASASPECQPATREGDFNFLIMASPISEVPAVPPRS